MGEQKSGNDIQQIIMGDKVKDILLEFAANTGIEQDQHGSSGMRGGRRYLWTDGFAVCTLLELWKVTGETRFRELALSLVERVHTTLGRHREDDGERRTGWISGLGEEEGGRHPTRGGLRIGKKLPERLPDVPLDEEEEWDRDGQYFHYLTKWMLALARVSAATGDSQYVSLAGEMAEGVHSGFTYSRGSSKRMYWKTSIDLSRPLVLSMGHHDPLDGFLTYYELRTTLPQNSGLDNAISDLQGIMQGQDFTTTDMLGLGGLMCDSYRAYNLYSKTKNTEILKLLEELLHCSLNGLKRLNQRKLDLPADYRLAFREFGLSIGLQAVEHLREALGKLEEGGGVREKVERILDYRNLVERIHRFWDEEGNRKSSTWKGHLDINMVMWATSLMPGGFLGGHTA